jgi:hypothetical protein
MVDAPRVRLAHGERVAADDGDEALPEGEALEDGARHPDRLVGEHRERRPPPGERLEHLDDARIGPRGVEEVVPVVRHETCEGRGEPVLAGRAEGALDEGAGAVAHVPVERLGPLLAQAE